MSIPHGSLAPAPGHGNPTDRIDHASYRPGTAPHHPGGIA
jgi:hypothetical protein